VNNWLQGKTNDNEIANSEADKSDSASSTIAITMYTVTNEKVG